MCCCGEVQAKKPHYKCCGKKQYDVETHQCCSTNYNIVEISQTCPGSWDAVDTFIGENDDVEIDVWIEVNMKSISL